MRYLKALQWLWLALLLLKISGANTLSAREIRGRVSDATSGQPLAFVHIRSAQTGSLSDIDGYFTIRLQPSDSLLFFSYVGFKEVAYTVDFSRGFHEVGMKPATFELSEVVVYPGENPAHRIIRNVMDARTQNHPMRLPSFTYRSYNKLVATLDYGHFEQQWQQRRDSVSWRAMQVLNRQHLFLMESVTRKQFRYPNLSNEVILANRVSGLENPLFTMLATELQSFAFYDNYIVLLEREYVSPLNPAAFNRYFYHLEDTLYQGVDSVFVVSYRPARNTRFDGLQGLLYVHTNGWALQNVVAEPSHAFRQGFSFRIQQKYEHFDGRHWFPVQLNTDWEFAAGESSSPRGLPLRVSTRSYISRVEINPTLRRRDFSNFSVDFEPGANRVDESLWHAFRADSLNLRERNTYHFIDSIGREHNFERMLNIVEPLVFGELPIGPVSLKITDFYRYNRFERHRPGVGGKTNRRFSQRVAAGGHIAWGTGDQRLKYSYFGEVVPWKAPDWRIGGSHSFDVYERGVPNFKEGGVLSLNELIRALYAGTRDYTERTRLYSSWRMMRNFVHAELSASYGETRWTDDYVFAAHASAAGMQSFRFAEAALRLRFAWGETFMNTPLRVMVMPSAFPVVSVNLTRGLEGIMNGDFSYLRAEGQFSWDYPIAMLGRQYWMLEAGWVSNGQLPWPLLLSARAADRNGLLASPFSFGTMTMNEFMSDRFVSIFFHHDFQRLLFRKPRYAPELVLISAAGWGSLQNPTVHQDVPVRDFPRGYFESGLAINKILPQRWVNRVVFGFSPGVEVLWRYGAYSLPRTSDNLTVKLNLLLAF